MTEPTSATMLCDYTTHHSCRKNWQRLRRNARRGCLRHHLQRPGWNLHRCITPEQSVEVMIACGSFKPCLTWRLVIMSEWNIGREEMAGRRQRLAYIATRIDHRQLDMRWPYCRASFRHKVGSLQPRGLKLTFSLRPYNTTQFVNRARAYSAVAGLGYSQKA